MLQAITTSMCTKLMFIGSLSSRSSIASSAFAPHVARFLIVRHGETDYNSDGRVQGTLESQLTSRGQMQATELGRWLARNEPSIGRVVVSPKKRTRETLAGITAEHQALSGVEREAAVLVPVDVRPGLREIELTAWEGRMRGDITAADTASADMPDADGARWNRWKADPMSFVFREDGHAPFRCLWERAGGEWQSLLDEATAAAAATDSEGKGAQTEIPPTLVVAHGAFNRALLLQSLGLPQVSWRDDKDHFVFDNCECVEIQWRPSLDGAGVGGSSCAVQWRRRYPQESKWRTSDEEVQRAAETYLAAAAMPTPCVDVIGSPSSSS
mmetsp:Transcript_2836/g.5906  ORF Transcript_2836/g.5906 Transcript_2836/m.5906 type:complete len:327 (-) Transcript_2836:224-1204(-)